MRCSFELPTKHIRELKGYQDFNFLLAHKVINDSEYMGAYGTGGLMDNGAYELGTPLTIQQLRIAENIARPDYVIAPDWLGDRERTLKGWREASALLHSEVAGVVQGDGVLDMLKCYGELIKDACPMICLPFRLERVELMKLIVQEKLLSPDVWFHFLGLKSMGELEDIVELDLPYVSIDTSKPIKAAIYGKTLDENLRNHSIAWDDHYTAELVKRMADNMEEFKRRANDAPSF